MGSSKEGIGAPAAALGRLLAPLIPPLVEIGKQIWTVMAPALKALWTLLRPIAILAGLVLGT